MSSSVAKLLHGALPRRLRHLLSQSPVFLQPLRVLAPFRFRGTKKSSHAMRDDIGQMASRMRRHQRHRAREHHLHYGAAPPEPPLPAPSLRFPFVGMTECRRIDPWPTFSPKPSVPKSWQRSARVATAVRNCGLSPSFELTASLAGGGINRCRASRISSSERSGWQCLWMGVSGTDADGIAGCRGATRPTGSARSPETSGGTAPSTVNSSAQVGGCSASGSIRCGGQSRWQGESNQS